MFIELSELNIKLLVLFIYPLFEQIEDHIKVLYLKKDKDNQLFKSFRYFLSYILAGIFLLIFNIRNSSKEKPTLNNNETFETIDTIIVDYSKIYKRKILLINFIFFALLCITGMFCQFYRKLFENKDYRNAQLSIHTFFAINCVILFSRLILHQKLYKHHFISLAIITIILLILFLVSIPFLKEIWSSAIYFLFYSALFGIYDVLKKKYMNISFNTPYFIMLIIGIVNTIILLIFDVIAYFAKPEISGIIIGLIDNIISVGDAFAFILDLILRFIWNLGLFLTIYYFSPCHTFIPEYISDFVSYVENVKKGENDFYSNTNAVIFIIGYIINFCFILVFNEVVILNICDLDYNTKKRIRKREKKDANIIASLDDYQSDGDDEEDNSFNNLDDNNIYT